MEAKTAPRGLQKTYPPRLWWVLAAKRPQEASKTPQEAPKRAQDGPRWPQDAPKTPPRGPKDAPKTPQVRPKTALKLLPAPKTPQDTPKRVPRGPKMPPRRPKTPPRGPQDTPKTPNQVISEDIKNRGGFQCSPPLLGGSVLWGRPNGPRWLFWPLKSFTVLEST